MFENPILTANLFLEAALSIVQVRHKSKHISYQIIELNIHEQKKSTWKIVYMCQILQDFIQVLWQNKLISNTVHSEIWVTGLQQIHNAAVEMTTYFLIRNFC